MSKIRHAWLLMPICFLGVSTIHALGQAPQTPDRIERKTSYAPGFELSNLNGEKVRLKDFQDLNKPVLLVFWATWCGYCADEVPKLNQLQRDYGEDLAILGIDVGEGEREVLAFARYHGIEYEVLLDEYSEVANDYRLRGVPTMVLIDGRGIILGKSHRIHRSLLSAIKELVQEG